jgi:hypothetical protein
MKNWGLRRHHLLRPTALGGAKVWAPPTKPPFRFVLQNLRTHLDQEVENPHPFPTPTELNIPVCISSESRRPAERACEYRKRSSSVEMPGHKPEHAVDLETGAIVAVTLRGADEGDTATMIETVAEAGEWIAETTAAVSSEADGAYSDESDHTFQPEGDHDSEPCRSLSERSDAGLFHHAEATANRQAFCLLAGSRGVGRGGSACAPLPHSTP